MSDVGRDEPELDDGTEPGQKAGRGSVITISTVIAMLVATSLTILGVGAADTAVANFFKSPEGMKTYEKWFQQPIPPKSLNLNVPMSAGLKKAYQNPTDSPDPAMY